MITKGNKDTKIVLIDDDVQLNETLKFCLESEGFEVHSAFNCEEGYELVNRIRPSVVLLDWVLPDMEGIELCAKLRSEGFHKIIFLLSKKKESFDKIKAYEKGITEYYVKPVHPALLIAMIRNKLNFLSTELDAKEIHTFGSLEYHPRAHMLFRGGQRRKLTVIENKLLYHFIHNPDKIINRETLSQVVWDKQTPNPRTIDMHIVRLRKKVEENPDKPGLIVTLRGEGYIFIRNLAT